MQVKSLQKTKIRMKKINYHSRCLCSMKIMEKLAMRFRRSPMTTLQLKRTVNKAKGLDPMVPKATKGLYQNSLILSKLSLERNH